ncbi:hypothetical protein LSAT2_020818 [Lamellibrachia satsuma]|nr:hypothetical protein LSAT2_020818 [Lamellibrachia satsuma]
MFLLNTAILHHLRRSAFTVMLEDHRYPRMSTVDATTTSKFENVLYRICRICGFTANASSRRRQLTFSVQTAVMTYCSARYTLLGRRLTALDNESVNYDCGRTTHCRQRVNEQTQWNDPLRA